MKGLMSGLSDAAESEVRNETNFAQVVLLQRRERDLRAGWLPVAV